MAKSSVSLSYMEATIKAIRTRILARLALQQQLTSLGKNTYTSLRFLIHPFSHFFKVSLRAKLLLL